MKYYLVWKMDVPGVTYYISAQNGQIVKQSEWQILGDEGTTETFDSSSVKNTTSQAQNIKVAPKVTPPSVIAERYPIIGLLSFILFSVVIFLRRRTQ